MSYSKLFIRLITITAAIISFSSCDITIPIKFNTSDLYGKYIAEYPFCKETLTLETTGEYIQEVVIYGNATTTKTILPTNKSSSTFTIATTILTFSTPSSIFRTKGHWKYDLSSKTLELEHPMIVSNDIGGLDENFNIPDADSLSLLAGRCLPIKVCFAINEDLGYMYIKQ